MHISIAGRLGSGKSTIAAILKERYGFSVYSTGAIHREIALSHKVSTLEMNNLMAHDLSYDHAIDDAVKRISVEKANETIIFDSRMAWNFAEHSFKVFVFVDPIIAAERVILNQRGEEEYYRDIEDARAKLIERSKVENKRFIDIYGVDSFDYSNYNLIIDSTYISADEVADIVMERFEEYLSLNTETNNIFMSPESLYPLVSAKDISDEMLSLYMADKDIITDIVSIIEFDGYHYITDGNLKVLASALQKVKLIKVLMVNKRRFIEFESKDNLARNIKKAGMLVVHRFEELGHFKYMSYPDWYFEK